MSSDRLRFDNRVAIVTGSGRGLGREQALVLGRLGAAVVMNSTTQATADKTVQEIINAGGKAVSHVGSVVNRDVADALVDKAITTFGHVDIVINNAGFAKRMLFESTTDDFFTEMMDVHVRGSFNVTQAAWPHMKKQNYGRIIMITSHWIFGKEEQSIYAAAKFALIGLTKTLCIEGKEYNISVNAVATAGFTDQVVANSEANQGQELMKQFVPAAQASSAIVWLVLEDCKVTGETVGATGKIVTRIFVAETHGFQGVAGEEWLHKGIRSNNVLFFGKTTAAASKDTECYLSKLYLVGFELSRKNNPNAMTEDVTNDLEWNLYRHLDVQGMPIDAEPVKLEGSSDENGDPKPLRPLFSGIRDIYAVGIILLEIGLMKSALQMYEKEIQDPNYEHSAIGFKERILETQVTRSGQLAGKEYSQAVKKCIMGAFDAGSYGNLSEAFSTQVVREVAEPSSASDRRL
ncbi:3-oxoacyl-acp reductase [Fusarium phyllophilum]|uniref:3-oxoacyl-acp reductase n=1 Tax=Fusarium phyllophilum TaxID=47803 RepID=A0A8H5IHN5_9HYPO|nr:3-oxoacyl-acp reductase [Fusarium phyllophilum]